MFRRATYADADDIARIYNQAMKPGIFAVSQIAPDTQNERVAWISEHKDPYPAFVHEIENGTVIGWCSLNRFSLRPDYADVAETSRYIDENHRGKGLGELMMAHLIETATTLGLRLLVSRAYERNIPSIKSGIGFQRVAVLHEAARINGEWQSDVFFWQKLR
ncbi:GNAT family N-acetyltransferase [Bradyrhizobium sp. 170]|uniref:GNAT family N-acetyltransferase n=1 Tax=Bradyrhizobium sp. 170 TaxID=2782641 RepID=UPI001FFF335C|nr:GNAT family N-acetyltransferase [Bradyrhizobium sp. 170]UPK05833.1 N-acetyltransferase [Bradyrhizobium sp. 170]